MTQVIPVPENLKVTDADLVGRLEPGLPDVQRTLNWVHLASRYPVRIRVENPPADLFRVSESAVVVMRGR